MSGGRKTELALPQGALQVVPAFTTEQGQRWDRACLRPGELWGEDLFLQDALSPQLMASSPSASATSPEMSQTQERCRHRTREKGLRKFLV